MLPPCGLASLTFISRVGFSTSTLAYMLDSLVRVSRRVGKNHFGKIAQSTLRPHPRRRIPRCLANQAVRRRPLRVHDPILPHDGGQDSRSPMYPLKPLAVLTAGH